MIRTPCELEFNVRVGRLWLVADDDADTPMPLTATSVAVLNPSLRSPA